jgi:hypothetical protein
MFVIRAQIFDGMKFNDTITALNNSLSAAPDFISQKVTAVYILVRYILLLIFPHPLSYDYSIAQLPNLKISDALSILSLIAMTALTIYALVNIRKKNIYSYGILFFLLTIAPVSNLLILIGAPMAERFLYMPSLGFCLIVAFLILKFIKADGSANNSGRISQLVAANKLLFSVTLILIGFYSVKTFSRNGVWKNDITLFSSDVHTADQSARAHYNFGTVLLQQIYPKENDAHKKNIILDSALTEFDKAVSIYPNYPDALINRGLIYKNKGNNKKGIENFMLAKKFSTRPRASLFYDLGDLYLQDGQNEKAVEEFDAGLSLNTAVFADVYTSKGVAFFRMKKYEEAIIEFQKAIELNPASALAFKNAGLATLI